MFRNHRVGEAMRAEIDLVKAADRDELEALKRLLFAPEMGRLAQAEERVGALDKKLGASDGFENAVADVMVRALLRASGEHAKDIAHALGPSLIMALSHEARISRDSLVEALRPVAPALVRSARRGWFRRIDKRVARLFGSRDQGLDADSSPARVERVLFLERASGLLIASWRRGGQNTDNIDSDNSDLISGLIAAITGFARDALGEKSLRSIDFGGRRVYLRMSDELIVAAETDSQLGPEQERALGARFLELLLRGEGVDAPQLAAAAGAISSAQPRAAAPISLRLAQIAAILAIAALAFYGWRTGVRMQHDQSISAAVNAFLTEHPEAAIAPLGLVTDHDAGKVEVRLLAGSAADLKAFSTALEAAAGPNYRVVTRVAFTALQSGYTKLRDTSPTGGAPIGASP